MSQGTALQALTDAYRAFGDRSYLTVARRALPLFGAGGNDVKTGTRTGSGNTVVVSQSPTIVQPVIADFTNMLHGHTNPAGGGQLSLSAILPAIPIISLSFSMKRTLA